MESILTSIKKMLGIADEYKHFDNDLIMHINSVFMILNQLGVGPEEPVAITSEMETWSKLLGDIKSMEAVKTYVYLKVKLIFDPPSNSFTVNAAKEQCAELESRLIMQAENK